ncbi:hypothetical protein CPSG_03546 [Coccidioides posadasii str. Silveira]|uniref:Uncharacterized protein n=1 Tax=Coccidioides posadasii (strain RMSCC 757 / Silveira) TaxID=443226 RepID=E9D0B8_COCPS|nr:hypothetical protein CPSG_03546 [Coccidioides posadasii str. Silveira]
MMNNDVASSSTSRKGLLKSHNTSDCDTLSSLQNKVSKYLQHKMGCGCGTGSCSCNGPQNCSCPSDTCHCTTCEVNPSSSDDKCFRQSVRKDAPQLFRSWASNRSPTSST